VFVEASSCPLVWYVFEGCCRYPPEETPRTKPRSSFRGAVLTRAIYGQAVGCAGGKGLSGFTTGSSWFAPFSQNSRYHCRSESSNSTLWAQRIRPAIGLHSDNGYIQTSLAQCVQPYKVSLGVMALHRVSFSPWPAERALPGPKRRRVSSLCTAPRSSHGVFPLDLTRPPGQSEVATTSSKSPSCKQIAAAATETAALTRSFAPPRPGHQDTVAQ